MKNSDLLAGILGDEFAGQLFGKNAVPTIAPAAIPAARGTIPNARPKASESKMRAEIQSLVHESLEGVTAVDQDELKDLIDAMTVYCMNQLR